ncbi:MAG: glycosyltransferase family 2 protein [Desulfovibrio sp.]|nr:glycosyltransferase family 2 protein [Desulfovibrio sp.]
MTQLKTTQGNSPDIKISIIISAYNCADYIERCIASVSQQNIHGVIETIIVDDASSDATVQILQQLKKKYENDHLIFVLHRLQKNSGPNIARNIAISKARGEYLIPLDADDFLFPEALKKLLAVAEKYGSDTAIGGVSVLDGETLHEVARLAAAENFFDINIHDHNDLYIFALSYHYSMLVKMSIIRKNKIRYNESLLASGDGYYLFSLFFHLNKVSIIKDIIYGRTINIGSICNKKRSYRWYESDISVYCYLYEKSFSANKRYIADIRFSYWLKDFFIKDISIIKKDFNNTDIYNIVQLLHNMSVKYDIFPEILVYLVDKSPLQLTPQHTLFLKSLTEDPVKALYIFKRYL